MEGPILTLTYRTFFKDDKGKVVEGISYAHFLPEELNVKGGISSEIRYRSIYRSVVYNSKINVSGSFNLQELKDLNLPEKDVLWERAFIIIGISDMKGIKDHILLNWNNEKIELKPGIMGNQVFASGVSTLVGLTGVKNSFSAIIF